MVTVATKACVMILAVSALRFGYAKVNEVTRQPPKPKDASAAPKPVKKHDHGADDETRYEVLLSNVSVAEAAVAADKGLLQSSELPSAKPSESPAQEKEGAEKQEPWFCPKAKGCKCWNTVSGNTVKGEEESKCDCTCCLTKWTCPSEGCKWEKKDAEAKIGACYEK